MTSRPLCPASPWRTTRGGFASRRRISSRGSTRRYVCFRSLPTCLHHKKEEKKKQLTKNSCMHQPGAAILRWPPTGSLSITIHTLLFFPLCVCVADGATPVIPGRVGRQRRLPPEKGRRNVRRLRRLLEGALTVFFVPRTFIIFSSFEAFGWHNMLRGTSIHRPT